MNFLMTSVIKLLTQLNMAAWYFIVLFVFGFANGKDFRSNHDQWKTLAREPSWPDFVAVDNGIIRVGVDTRVGGSITFLSALDGDESVINIHDMGREVQMSFYSGPNEYEPTPGSQQCNTTWRHGVWPWNPIGAGDVVGHSGSVSKVEKNDTSNSIYIQSVPLQWACDNVPCNCMFEKWIQLSGSAVVVNARLTNSRKDKTQYGSYGQELPAIYTIGSLYQAVAYNGTSPFTNGPLTYFQQTGESEILATEHWAALVNKDNWGLGVFQPGSIYIRNFFFGTPGNYGPNNSSTGYLSPYHSEILDWNIVYDYQFHLVLGNLDDIRAYAYKNQEAISNCLVTDFRYNASRHHWYYINANDSGLPNGYWQVIMEQIDPQVYGPNCLWKAQDHPYVYINASFSTGQASVQAQLFWNAVGVGEHFDEVHSVRFTIVDDGQYHIYKVDLSSASSYTGSAYGLRFDPVEKGAKGAYVNIAFIRLS